MKKYLIAVLAYMTIAGIFPAAAAGANILYNGGFEGPVDNGSPGGWKITVNRGTEAEIALDSGDTHSGENALKVAITPPGGRVVVYLDEAGAAPITPGAAYEASCWIRTQNLDYNRFHEAPAFRFNFRPQRIRPGKLVDLINKLQGTSGWVQISQKATAPENSSRIHLDFVLTSGTVWIDDVEVRRLR
ncbi:MAG: hypothetical protein KFF46_10160 [Desulfobacterales bacterium]|nr:hypothetical protein [Desulfobacterales bacterium]